MSVKSEIDELEDDPLDTSPVTDSPASPFDINIPLSTVTAAKKPRRFAPETKVVLQSAHLPRDDHAVLIENAGYLDGGLTKPQFEQLQEIAQKTGLSTQQVRSWFTRKRTKAQVMNTSKQAPSSGQENPRQYASQATTASSTARAEGPHSFPFTTYPLSLSIFPLSLSARSPSAPRGNRPAFLDAYFKYRKFNEGKPRLDIDGAERDAALWYTTFHNITLDQLQQANNYWYPLEQEPAPQAPSHPPMQLHTPSPSSPSPSPEAPVVYPHVRPDPSETEDQVMDEDVNEEYVQDARLEAFLGSVVVNQEYHLPPSASIKELFSNLHSGSIASFLHNL